jgi:hypothetical protein
MAATHSIEINVDGEVEISLPAERAVLKVQVFCEDEEKREASQAVIDAAKKVFPLVVGGMFGSKH